MFKALFQYRQFIFESVKREFFAKYQTSVLGSLWAVLNPLSMILVYTLIFSQVMMAKLPGIDSAFAYSVYLCAGIIPWSFFLEISSRSVGMFIEQANMLKKVKIPKVCLPVIICMSAAVNFLIISLLYLIFLLLVGMFPGVVIVGVVPLLFIMVMMALGIGVFLGTLNVFIRDIGQVYAVLIQFWFWFTPIIYPTAIIPENIKWIMPFNPMYPIVEGFHSIFVESKFPDFQQLIPVVVFVLLLCIFSLHFFRKHSEEIVDEL